MGGAGHAELAGERAAGAENLHAVVARVGDGDHARRRHGGRSRRREGYGARPGKVAGMLAVGSHGAGERAVWMERRDAVVASVGDGEQGARRRPGGGLRRTEPPAAGGGGALSPPVEERAVRSDDPDAAVTEVDRGHPGTRGGIRGGLRRVEFPGAVSPRPELAGERAIGVKDLDTVVAAMRDDDPVARRRPGYIVRIFEQPVAGAARPELEGEVAVDCAENLDAVVVLVGHGDQAAVRRVRHVRGLAELPLGGAGRAELEGERGAGGADVEYLDAVVALVSDGHAAAVRRPGDRRRPKERAVGGGAYRAEREGGRAVRMVYLDAVITCVCHGERALQADAGGRRNERGRRAAPRRPRCAGRAGRATRDRRAGRRKPIGRRQFQRGMPRELRVCRMPGAGRAERPGELAAVGIENLHAAVARVGDDEPVARRVIVDGTRAVVELPLGGAGRAECEVELYEVAARSNLPIVEHLHAAVARVGDGHAVAVPGKGGGRGPVELPLGGAGRAERKGVRAVDV